MAYYGNYSYDPEDIYDDDVDEDECDEFFDDDSDFDLDSFIGYILTSEEDIF